MISINVYLQGFALSFGLIVAIGAQNAFVLRQGLRREHIVSIVVFCAIADALLIAFGVFGMAEFIGRYVGLARWLAVLGAGFLFVYGWQAFGRALRANQLASSQDGEPQAYWAAMFQVVAFTLFNPHVYLDTLLLVGSVGAQQPDALRLWFVLGACSASVIWFSLLGFGAMALAPLFANPKTWRLLDAFIGVVMWGLAGSLLSYLANTL